MSIFLIIVWMVIFTGSFAGFLRNLRILRKTNKMLKEPELSPEMEQKIREDRVFGIVGLSLSALVFIWMVFGLIEPVRVMVEWLRES